MTYIIGNKDRERKSKVDTEKWKEHSEYYKNQEDIKNKELKKQSAANLEGKILKYNTAGEPTLEIHPDCGTAIYTNNREDFDNMMQIFESAGWGEINSGNKKPTDIEYMYTPSHIAAGFGIIKEVSEKKFEIQSRYIFNKRAYYDILSMEQFCNREKITPEIMNELNNWYNKYKPKRGSTLCDSPV